MRKGNGGEKAPRKTIRESMAKVVKQDYSFTLLALLLVAFLLFGVPQVYNVLFQMPGRLFGPDFVPVLLWLLYHLLLFPIGSLMVRVAAADFEIDPERPRFLYWSILSVVGVVSFLAVNSRHDSTDPADDWLLRVQVGAPLAILAWGGWWGARVAWVNRALLWFRDGTHLLGRRLRRKFGFVKRLDDHGLTYVLASVGRLLLFGYGIVMMLGGAVVWFLATSTIVISERAYTVGAIWMVLYFLLATGRALDGITRHHPSRPVRAVLLALLVVTALSLGPSDVGEETDGADTRWLASLSARMDEVAREEGPFLIVSASGGGSRAALFASLVIEGLEREGYTDRIVLMSGVSGGSVASAYFVARDEAEEREWTNTLVDDLRGRIRDSAADVLRFYEGEGGGEGEEETAERARAVLEPLVRGEPSPSLEAILRSGFVDDMNTDFMAPLLLGIVLLGTDRGERLTDFWEERFGWEEEHNHVVPRGRPLLLLNATFVHEGWRVAIGYPRLPEDLFDALDERDGSIARWNPGLRLSLAEGVRLSANFPYGLPLAELRGERSPTDDDFLLVDGGVVDNTGIDAIASVLNGLGSRAEAGDRTARKVLRQMREHGVILVEIDSGAKPQRASPLARLLPEILLPPHALSKSSHETAVHVKEDYVDHLKESFDPEEEGHEYGKSAGFERVDFQCNQNENVMTAWALGPSGKARVIVQYLVAEGMKMPVLEGHFNDMARLRGAAAAEREAIVERMAARQTQARVESLARQALFEAPAGKKDLNYFEEIERVKKEEEKRKKLREQLGPIQKK